MDFALEPIPKPKADSGGYTLNSERRTPLAEVENEKSLNRKFRRYKRLGPESTFCPDIWSCKIGVQLQVLRHPTICLSQIGDMTQDTSLMHCRASPPPIPLLLPFVRALWDLAICQQIRHEHLAIAAESSGVGQSVAQEEPEEFPVEHRSVRLSDTVPSRNTAMAHRPTPRCHHWRHRLDECKSISSLRSPHPAKRHKK
ncbi:unnamed protein product [Somion occarium]|uniref:Uncharacterized protein n=1 Tax=Somion occarium TaxID=3059160 RepID=A0ABP1CNI1_9APHY